MDESDDKAREDGLAALRGLRKLAEKGLLKNIEAVEPIPARDSSPPTDVPGSEVDE